jgi:hypothetical protein
MDIQTRISGKCPAALSRLYQSSWCASPHVARGRSRLLAITVRIRIACAVGFGPVGARAGRSIGAHVCG